MLLERTSLAEERCHPHDRAVQPLQDDASSLPSLQTTYPTLQQWLVTLSTPKPIATLITNDQPIFRNAILRIVLPFSSQVFRALHLLPELLPNYVYHHPSK